MTAFLVRGDIIGFEAQIQFWGKHVEGRRAMHIYHFLHIKNAKSGCFSPPKTGIPLAVYAFFGG